MNLRRIGRVLGMSYQRVANWAKAYAAQLPDAPPPPSAPRGSGGTRRGVYLCRDKKTRIYLLTQVDRTTRCFLSWSVATDRDQATIQTLVDAAPHATQYYSDAWTGYENVVYSPGQHTSLPNKTQTYRVEAGNAELRHYLARLGRRSRCFSRSLAALRAALSLFVFAWNRRQLAKQQYPQYHYALADFLYP